MVANDFIQCRKVAEHILDKLLGEGNAGSPGAGDTDPSSPTNSGTSVDQIELTCNDQVSMAVTMSHMRMNQQSLAIIRFNK